jgi:hypothetical protein
VGGTTRTCRPRCAVKRAGTTAWRYRLDPESRWRPRIGKCACEREVVYVSGAQNRRPTPADADAPTRTRRPADVGRASTRRIMRCAADRGTRRVLRARSDGRTAIMLAPVLRHGRHYRRRAMQIGICCVAVPRAGRVGGARDGWGHMANLALGARRRWRWRATGSMGPAEDRLWPRC